MLSAILPLEGFQGKEVLNPKSIGALNFYADFPSRCVDYQDKQIDPNL